jgi:two-component system, chemotaxis family, CheB/CheR fusion protein
VRKFDPSAQPTPSWAEGPGQRGVTLVRSSETSNRKVEELREHADENELAATNEELSVSNEELQSLNEELRVAQEQLLSNYDELSELNGKLARQNRELLQLNSDLVNVFTTAEIPIVILDAEARIRRFSNLSHKLVHVRDSDIGRPFDDLRLKVEAPELPATVSEVIESGVAREWEVRDRDGCWHRLAIRPYRGPNDSLDGVWSARRSCCCATSRCPEKTATR